MVVDQFDKAYLDSNESGMEYSVVGKYFSL